MKTLQFTISHAHLEDLMSRKCLARIHNLEDLGHGRDHYVIVALVREEHLDEVIDKAADRPRWVRWPAG